MLDQMQSLSETMLNTAKNLSSSSSFNTSHKSSMMCPSSLPANNSLVTAPTPTPTPTAAGAAAAVTTAVVRMAAGKQIGDRLFLQTAKLKLLLGCLEALNEASVTHDPRAIAFTPQGVYITIIVPADGRCHSLALPNFFFVRYRCPVGFRAIIDLNEFIQLLNQIYSTHHGRCLEIMDQPDNTLLVHALLDDNKFFDATLKTHTARTVVEPILSAAYYRYPFLLKVSTDWLHNIFKRLQQRQRAEVIVEFNGETRALEFLSTMEGAPCCEGVIIPLNHVLKNPFTPPADITLPAADAKDTHVVYTDTKIVSENARDRVPERTYLSGELAKEAATSLLSFRYRSQFTPRSIWLAVKRNKVGSFIYLYLAPGQPILFQYVLQRSNVDSRTAATYDTWIKSVEKAANPHIRMPSGGSAAVARKMLELAPNLGSNEQTLRVGTAAIQQTTGYNPTLVDRQRLLDESTSYLRPADQKRPAKDVGFKDDKSNDQTLVNNNLGNGFIMKKRKVKAKPMLDADGNPIKKKRGRPPKNPQPPTPAVTPAPTVAPVAPVAAQK